MQMYEECLWSKEKCLFMIVEWKEVLNGRMETASTEGSTASGLINQLGQVQGRG